MQYITYNINIYDPVYPQKYEESYRINPKTVNYLNKAKYIFQNLLKYLSMFRTFKKI